MCQVNNPVTFSGIPMESEEFLNKIVEALGIIIDRRPKGKPHGGTLLKNGQKNIKFWSMTEWG